MSGRPRKAAPLGGHAVIATVLNERLSWPDDRQVTRQQVYVWVKRATLNMAGEPPPDPVKDITGPKRTTPGRVWDTRAWIGWAISGVPRMGGQGWVLPGLRRVT